MHSILEIETDLPEKLVQIAEELIATGYFSSVSNIVLEPVQFVPKN
jgi:Arc/MetJ-type ribon-helix-helix transcriptional regulator